MVASENSKGSSNYFNMPEHSIAELWFVVIEQTNKKEATYVDNKKEHLQTVQLTR